jgi:hypothetical protein
VAIKEGTTTKSRSDAVIPPHNHKSLDRFIQLKKRLKEKVATSKTSTVTASFTLLFMACLSSSYKSFDVRFLPAVAAKSEVAWNQSPPERESSIILFEGRREKPVNTGRSDRPVVSMYNSYLCCDSHESTDRIHDEQRFQR